MDEKNVKATTNVPESAAGNVRAEAPAAFSEAEAVEAEQTEPDAPEADNEAADVITANPLVTKQRTPQWQNPPPPKQRRQKERRRQSVLLAPAI